MQSELSFEHLQSLQRPRQLELRDRMANQLRMQLFQGRALIHQSLEALREIDQRARPVVSDFRQEQLEDLELR